LKSISVMKINVVLQITKNIILYFLLFGLLTSCTPHSGSESISSEETPNNEDTITIANFDKSILFQEMKTIIENAFAASSPSVTYDAENALLHIIVTANAGTVEALNTNTAEAKALWKSMTEPLCSFTQSGYELLVSENLQIGCALILLSDKDSEKAIFSVLNGVEVYNAFGE